MKFKAFWRPLPLMALTVSLLACQQTSSVSTPRPLDSENASILAEVLFKNYEVGGARFEVSSSYVATNETLQLSGEVDWKNHRGHAVVHATGGESSISEIYWGDGGILERIPNLNQLLLQAGHRNMNFVVREPNFEQRQIDQAIQVVAQLAMEQRENPLLMQQKTGSAFLRTDVLRGRKVDVMRYGTRNIYWIDHGTGQLLRFEGNSESGTAPRIVDIVELRRVDIPGPMTSEVIDLKKVQTLYDLARSQ